VTSAISNLQTLQFDTKLNYACVDKIYYICTDNELNFKLKQQREYKIMRILTLILTSFVLNAFAYSGQILNSVESNLPSTEKYLFYFHGSKQEEGQFISNWEDIIKELAKTAPYVISENRSSTEPNDYAERIVEQVKSLMNSGVSPTNISISGYSKGAVIALAVASKLQNKDIKFILLSGCSNSMNSKFEIDTKEIQGNFLAIYDSKDNKFGSCKSTLMESNSLRLEEKQLNSGKGHKLFAIPKSKFMNQWANPLFEFSDL